MGRCIQSSYPSHHKSRHLGSSYSLLGPLGLIHGPAAPFDREPHQGE